MNMSLFLQICMAVFCLASVGLHIVKKNMTEVYLYCLQSAAVTALLGVSLWRHRSVGLLAVVAVTLLVKVILAPAFFARLIKRHELKINANTYANAPETLLAIVLTLLLVGSHFFAPLTNLVPENHTYLVLSLTVLLTSILLVANRKGILSQAVGILSLENAIMAFAFFAGLEQSPVLELGIVFDVFVWLMVASVFVTMVHKHFGASDVTSMKNLKG